MHIEIYPSLERVLEIGDEEIQFFFKDTAPYRKYLMCVENNRMIGIISHGDVKVTGSIQYLHLGAVSVHPDFKNRGIAEKMLREFLPILKREGLALYPGHYEPEGLRYLKHKIDALCEEYGVGLISH